MLFYILLHICLQLWGIDNLNGVGKTNIEARHTSNVIYLRVEEPRVVPLLGDKLLRAWILLQKEILGPQIQGSL